MHMHAISDENTKQNEEILFYKAHQEVWFWLVHVECSFLLNKTNRITLGHLFIGYYFQRTEMILFNCKQLTHSFLWAVFILTSRMSDLAGRSLAWFTRTVFTIVYKKVKFKYINPFAWTNNSNNETIAIFFVEW